MKKLIFAISLISTLLISSCNNTTPNNVQETPSTQVTPNKTQSSNEDTNTSNQSARTTADPESSDTNNNQTQTNNKQLEVGTVKELVNGDLKCYVTLIDENGTEHNVGATFEICAEESKFLNKKIRATYEVVSVNDCESAEPCGKTRQESLITKMEVLNETSENKTQGNDTQTLSFLSKSP